MTTEAPGKASLAKKIVAIMKVVHTVKKDKKHDHFGYGFASADAVVAALRDALITNAVAIFPNQISCEEIQVQKGNGKVTVITKVCVENKIVDADSGEFEVCRVYGYGMDDQDKGASKAGTMAEKEYLKKQFLIVTPDDPAAGQARRAYQGSRDDRPAAPATRPAAPSATRPAAPSPNSAPAKAAPPAAASSGQTGRTIVRAVIAEVKKFNQQNGPDYFKILGSEGETWKTFAEPVARDAQKFASTATYVELALSAEGLVTGLKPA